MNNIVSIQICLKLSTKDVKNIINKINLYN